MNDENKYTFKELPPLMKEAVIKKLPFLAEDNLILGISWPLNSWYNAIEAWGVATNKVKAEFMGYILGQTE